MDQKRLDFFQNAQNYTILVLFFKYKRKGGRAPLSSKEGVVCIITNKHLGILYDNLQLKYQQKRDTYYM